MPGARRLILDQQLAQQGGDLRICLTFRLTTGEAACDAGDEVGDLYAWFSAGIAEPDIG
jgi:hypothetical protein